MVKNNYLSREEQRIWEFVKDKQIIDNELIREIFPEMKSNKRNKLLHNLYKKGYIKRAVRDLYYTENLDNYYLLALRIHPGYVGLTSALKMHGLLDYEDFTIFIMTRNTYKQVKLENYTPKFIPLKNHYAGHTDKDGVQVSTLEKTFFDCFLRSRYVGYSVLSKAIYDADINWKGFLFWFKQGPLAVRQKAGFILELLKEKTDFSLPSYVLKELAKGIKNPVRIGSGRTTYYSRWKLQCGVKNILGWY